MTGLRLAVAQSPGKLDGVEARLGWLERTVARLEADLVLLPELFATGYNIGALIRERAESADGPIAARVRAIAERSGVAICYGYAERDGGRVYNSAQCFGPDGTVIGHHRKLAVPPGFETEYFAAGAGCQVFDYLGLRLAIVICYDVEFPEVVRHVAALGAQVVLVPTALGAQWGWVGRQMVPVRAYENGVFLAYANHAGVENGLEYLGESFIAAPDGVELVRAGAAVQVIEAEIDAGRVAAAQARLPYLRDRLGLEI